MANTDNFTSAYHLATADGKNNRLYQPLRKNNFKLSIDFSQTKGMMGFFNQPSDTAGGTGISISKYFGTSSPSQDSVQKAIEVSVISCRAPHFSLGEIDVSKFNSRAYFAGRPEFTADDISIDDFYNTSGKSGIMAWMACTYDVENDVIFDAENYMATATLSELKPNGEIVRQWSLENCWIKSISNDDFDATSNDKKTFSATMRYDRARPIEVQQ